MLPKHKRLTKKDFKEIFDHGQSFRGRYFILRVVLVQTDSLTKFGVSVTKKAFSKATDRNKLRRRGYSALSNTIVKPSYRCLFSVGRATRMPAFRELKEDIRLLLDQAHILVN